MMNGMKKPDKCCDCGEFTCQVPMPINGRLHCIDFCIADIIAALNAANITTIGSCCGHLRHDGNVMLEDGRVLSVENIKKEKHRHESLICTVCGKKDAIIEKLKQDGQELLTRINAVSWSINECNCIEISKDEWQEIVELTWKPQPKEEQP